MHFLGHKLRDGDYCKCKDRKGHTSVVDDEGYWDVCIKCNKPIVFNDTVLPPVLGPVIMRTLFPSIK